MDVVSLGLAKSDARKRYAPGVSPDAYGAKGDGTTNDTAAIQAALDSGAKRIVFRHGGTYIISADLAVHSGQTIEAYGATIRRAPGTNTELNLLSIAGSVNTFITDVTVRGGTWDGNRPNVTIPQLENYPTNNGIRVFWARNVLIEDATIQNCWGGGILAGDGIVLGIRIDNCTARYNYDNGLWFRPGVWDGMISNSRAHGQTYHGIDAIRCDYITFSNCHAWDNGPAKTGEGAGFRMEGCRWSQMTDCTAWSNGVLAGFALTYTNEGKFGWTWTGAYSDATSYTAGQTVQWPPQANPNHASELGAYYCIAAPPGPGYAPSRNSPYWVPCSYDNAQGGNRNNYAIKLVGCRAKNNYGLGTSGSWQSGASYQPQESVWYLNGTNWQFYVCTTAVTSTTAPPSDAAHWLGPATPSGFLINDSTHVELLGCQAEHGYNGVSVGGTNGGSADIRIRNSDLRNNAWDGVAFGAMVSGTSAEVSGCHFDGNRNNGIETPGGYTFALDVHDNVFTGAVQQARALYENGTTTTVAFRRNRVNGQATETLRLLSATSYMDGTNDMTGTVDHASGAGSFAGATTATVTFATAFRVAPVAAGISITPTGAPAGDYYVSAVSATGFTVTCAVSGTWGFSWTARNVMP